ncbi:MAG: Nif3-like dinuclear metal center hexameric protein [Kastovskya adunca ATA6-11-RM4]|jgi:putative NIF3 family GTP cyclohydrolase 1 type 2|nr:Nif3-like dinuclear metal center hexameric protein [Kastovskya adunca ATA6-11-RM4]
MLSLDKLAEFLNQYFAIHRFNDDPGGVYRPSNRAIQRIGLALEPWQQLPQWAEQAQLDALFLHRPWKLKLEQLKSDVGVVSYHLAFDERLTLGFNPRLADALGMSALLVIGEKEGRPIGMSGEMSPQCFTRYCRDIGEVFGGQDQTEPGECKQVSRVAVVGAMTDALVREAASRGADVYVTGQWRQSAKKAVQETGIGVVTVGHRRCEEWGLRALAGLLQERWLGLRVVLPPGVEEC